MWTLWSKIYFIKNGFWKFYEVLSERGIFINTDSWPLGYVLWFCGSKSQDFFTFIQIGSGYTVHAQSMAIRVLEFSNRVYKIRNTYITVWQEQIWIKVKKSWLLLPQHQSTYPRGPESASIEIPPFRPKFT